MRWKSRNRSSLARGHELSVERPADELTLWGDPARLQQVITNLLTNAARYTPKGGKIEFRASREKDSLVIRVRDNGHGHRQGIGQPRFSICRLRWRGRWKARDRRWAWG